MKFPIFVLDIFIFFSRHKLKSYAYINIGIPVQHRLSTSENVTGTPFEYVGVGYNLLDGNPEVEQDHGLLLDRRVLQVNSLNHNLLSF